jgi:2,3-bisphosphoglycerate-independent phosphoglycerate mutase
MNPNPSHDAFNAVKLAKTPVADRLMRDYPWTLIKTSGEDVGLPDRHHGQQRSRAPEHRRRPRRAQEIARDDQGLRAGLHTNAAIAAHRAREVHRARSLHLIGINSDAGVHGCSITSTPSSARASRSASPSACTSTSSPTGATPARTPARGSRGRSRRVREIGVGYGRQRRGRYYAMDRDHRWERVKLAYACSPAYGRRAGHLP